MNAAKFAPPIVKAFSNIGGLRLNNINLPCRLLLSFTAAADFYYAAEVCDATNVDVVMMPET